VRRAYEVIFKNNREQEESGKDEGIQNMDSASFGRHYAADRLFFRKKYKYRVQTAGRRTQDSGRSNRNREKYGPLSGKGNCPSGGSDNYVKLSEGLSEEAGQRRTDAGGAGFRDIHFRRQWGNLGA